MGLNMNHLFPAGGLGRDYGISVKVSMFPPGWVLGGFLDDLNGTNATSVNFISAETVLFRCAKLKFQLDPQKTVDFWE